MQSGYIGEIPRIVTFDWIGRRFKFEDQKFAGLPIRVDYEGTNYVSINPVETNTQIVFPNAGLINVTTETFLDINRSGTLQPGYFYYLYVRQDEGLVDSFAGGWADTNNYFISTVAPTKFYTSMGTVASFALFDRANSTYYSVGTYIRPPSGVADATKAFCFKCVQAGTSAASIDPNIFNVDVYEKVIDGGCKWECRYDIHDSICIAYLAVTSAGNMSGTWNLWSVHRQPEQYWDATMTNSSDVQLSLPAMICPSTGLLSLTRPSGGTVFSFYREGSWMCSSPSISIGSASTGVLYYQHESEYLPAFHNCSYGYYCTLVGSSLCTVSLAFNTSSSPRYDLLAHAYQTSGPILPYDQGPSGETPPTVSSVSGVLRLTRSVPPFPIILRS